MIKLIGISLLIGAFVSVAFVIYHSFFALKNLNSKRFQANLFAPFVLLLPGLFTPNGNYHRKRALVGICLTSVFFLLLFVFDEKTGAFSH